ncbi:hypothetical protein AAMO2058_001278700 [Amorphochlora amoebiformis]
MEPRRWSVVLLVILRALSVKRAVRPLDPPFSKRVPGTLFVVDAFNYKAKWITAYFLSHAHSDHYTGLNSKWNSGPVYCSRTTARIIIDRLGVNASLVHVLSPDTSHSIHGTQVQLVDANHCPGAVQFLFTTPGGERYLHCGDMRFDEKLMKSEALSKFRNCTTAYIDTTYCHPRYEFPPEESASAYAANETQKALKSGLNSALVLIQAYNIGKEKLLAQVHRKTARRIFASSQKLAYLRCIDLDPSVSSIFTSSPNATDIHVVRWGLLGDTWPFFRPNPTVIEAYLKKQSKRYTRVVGIVPSGWMYNPKSKGDISVVEVKTRGGISVSIHLVPYSEHSSYLELKQYLAWLKPQKIVGTVGMSGESGLTTARHLSRITSRPIVGFPAQALAYKRGRKSLKIEEDDEGERQTSILDFFKFKPL